MADTTQAALAREKRAPIRYVGADGRKVSGGRGEKHRGLSIRHKLDEEYTIPSKDALVELSTLTDPLTRFARAALRIGCSGLMR